MATASALQLFPPGLRLGVGLGRDSVRLRVRVLLPVLQRVIHAVPIREDAGPSPHRLGGPHGLRHGAEVALTRLRAHAGCLELQAQHEAIGGVERPAVVSDTASHAAARNQKGGATRAAAEGCLSDQT